MVLAVLQRRAGLKLGRQDVYAATVGGVRLTEPSVDLAVAVALASSAANLSVPRGVVAIGEVGLAGEVRRVAALPRRLAEAERMGFPARHRPGGLGGPLEPADGPQPLMQVVQVRTSARRSPRSWGPPALRVRRQPAAKLEASCTGLSTGVLACAW
jgi:DNA repair protein RadA/Sms